MSAPAPERIEFGRGEHVSLFGHTGTGKTYLARRYLRAAPVLVAIDPKHTLRIPGARVRAELRPREDKQILRPPVFGKEERAWYEDQYNRIFELGRKRGGLYVYTDEVNPTGTPQYLNPGLDRLIRQGRELGISVWTASQRPRLIPSTLFSESSHIVSFFVLDKQDRDRVGEWTGERGRAILAQLAADPRSPHDFLYFHVPSRRVLYVHQPG